MMSQLYTEDQQRPSGRLAVGHQRQQPSSSHQQPQPSAAVAVPHPPDAESHQYLQQQQQQQQALHFSSPERQLHYGVSPAGGGTGAPAGGATVGRQPRIYRRAEDPPHFQQPVGAIPGGGGNGSSSPTNSAAAHSGTAHAAVMSDAVVLPIAAVQAEAAPAPPVVPPLSLSSSGNNKNNNKRKNRGGGGITPTATSTTIAGLPAVASGPSTGSARARQQRQGPPPRETSSSAPNSGRAAGGGGSSQRGTPRALRNVTGSHYGAKAPLPTHHTFLPVISGGTAPRLGPGAPAAVAAGANAFVLSPLAAAAGGPANNRPLPGVHLPPLLPPPPPPAASRWLPPVAGIAKRKRHSPTTTTLHLRGARARAGASAEDIVESRVRLGMNPPPLAAADGGSPMRGGGGNGLPGEGSPLPAVGGGHDQQPTGPTVGPVTAGGAAALAAALLPLLPGVSRNAVQRAQVHEQKLAKVMADIARQREMIEKIINPTDFEQRLVAFRAQQRQDQAARQEQIARRHHLAAVARAEKAGDAAKRVEVEKEARRRRNDQWAHWTPTRFLLPHGAIARHNAPVLPALASAPRSGDAAGGLLAAPPPPPAEEAPPVAVAERPFIAGSVAVAHPHGTGTGTSGAMYVPPPIFVAAEAGDSRSPARARSRSPNNNTAGGGEGSDDGSPAGASDAAVVAAAEVLSRSPPPPGTDPAVDAALAMLKRAQQRVQQADRLRQEAMADVVAAKRRAIRVILRSGRFAQQRAFITAHHTPDPLSPKGAAAAAAQRRHDDDGRLSPLLLQPTTAGLVHSEVALVQSFCRATLSTIVAMARGAGGGGGARRSLRGTAVPTAHAVLGEALAAQAASATRVLGGGFGSSGSGRKGGQPPVSAEEAADVVEARNGGPADGQPPQAAGRKKPAAPAAGRTVPAALDFGDGDAAFDGGAPAPVARARRSLQPPPTLRVTPIREEAQQQQQRLSRPDGRSESEASAASPAVTSPVRAEEATLLVRDTIECAILESVRGYIAGGVEGDDRYELGDGAALEELADDE